MAVKCDEDSDLHPLGYLHTYFVSGGNFSEFKILHQNLINVFSTQQSRVCHYSNLNETKIENCEFFDCLLQVRVRIAASPDQILLVSLVLVNPEGHLLVSHLREGLFKYSLN